MKKKLLYESYISELTEPSDINTSGFELKDELNPKFWNNDEFDLYARRAILRLSKEVLSDIDLPSIPLEDIVVTGSVSNYNWNDDYSDIDVHIILDFSEINEDTELVKKFFDEFRKNWNEKHDNLSIYDYPVEIYIQNVDEEHSSTGVYSVLRGKWITKPDKSKFNTSETNDDNIKKNVAGYMNEIDELQDEFDNDGDPEYIYDKACELFDNIKEMRKSSMKSDTEMNDGNLIFKSLRRNRYMEKLLNIRTESYDRKYSI